MFFGPVIVMLHLTSSAKRGYSQFGWSFVLNFEKFAPSLVRNSDSPICFDPPVYYILQEILTPRLLQPLSPSIRHLRLFIFCVEVT